MARTVAIGIQKFDDIINKNVFYVDKTHFIKEWWESEDAVTLITRPRRFGKTLNMSMLECFFSNKYAGSGHLFEGLGIWNEEKYRKLQGTYPVIFLSFSGIKERTYKNAYKQLCKLVSREYSRNTFLLDAGTLSENEKKDFNRVTVDMSEVELADSINQLSEYLFRYYGKKVIILLDEYDTPMQEAYVNGYWGEMVCLIRNLFNSTFKTNPYLERALLTGITRVSRESVFSDLNNLNVVTTTSDEYSDLFGFSETEVFAAMDEQGLADKENVKKWYDGFTFGSKKGIYNPWSIINYLSKGKLEAYWANTSSNNLISKLLKQGNTNNKVIMEDLMTDIPFVADIDEQIVFDQLDYNSNAVWSLLLASGYLKVDEHHTDPNGLNEYVLSITNFEVKLMFRKMISGWFNETSNSYNDFIKAFLLNDVDYMNEYMNRITVEMFSSFDAGNKPSEKSEPERFYHGFVLGLMVDLSDQYFISSNRESGFGRYDVILEPIDKNKDAYIIEFKVFNTNKDETLEGAVRSALAQIEDKKYEKNLILRGIPKSKIRKYGFAFQGKKVLIGSDVPTLSD